MNPDCFLLRPNAKVRGEIYMTKQRINQLLVQLMPLYRTCASYSLRSANFRQFTKLNHLNLYQRSLCLIWSFMDE